MTDPAPAIDAQVLGDCTRRAGSGEGALVELLRAATGMSEQAILAYFAGRLGVPLATSLPPGSVARDFTARVPVAYARRQAVAALNGSDGALTVATCEPLDMRAVDDVARVLGRPVRPVLAPRSAILAALDSAYSERMRGDDGVSEDLGSLDGLVRESAALAASEDLLELSRKPPLVRLVNRLLLQALEARASDVHFQPAPEALLVRFRIDGLLHDVASLPSQLRAAVVSRVKVMGRMDIAEKRLAQDGRATVAIGNRNVDLRLASLPTAHGEQIVVRLLDRNARLLALDELGMPPDLAREFRRMLRASNRVVLVTGPTGSGKTTTLYAALQELDARALHVVTLEDPIEYHLDGVSQSQVNLRKGMTFVGGLRHVLRQDPDVIMVGEIRDAETARMAVQSALTGHLVLSTLHTNDAVSAVTRLLDLGIEPYLVSSALCGVVAQRLVRRVCPECAAPAPPDPDLLRRAGVSAAEGQFRRGAGCERCLHTGYLGRTGVFELVRVDADLRERITRGEVASRIAEALARQGLRTMRDDGVAKALAGTTTLDEVLRVTQDYT